MTQQRFGTVARVASRALLVAGFAGGAWLLSSAAAHAATSTTEVIAPAVEIVAPAQPATERPDLRVVSRTAPVTTTVLPAGRTAHHSVVRHSAVIAYPTVRATGPAAGSGTRQVPGLPERAPIPAYPGSDNSGSSTTTSVSHFDGGAFAAGT